MESFKEASQVYVGRKMQEKLERGLSMDMKLVLTMTALQLEQPALNRRSF